MRAKPDYTWEWFESHTPFKRILENTVELVIEHTIQRIPIIAGCYSVNHHFIITYNKELFEKNFEDIKQALLKTNICKYNKDVYRFVEEQTCSTRSFCNLITHGCGSYRFNSGSFEWRYIKEEN